MELSTLRSFLAVTCRTKGLAVQSGRIDAYVREPAVVVGASAFLEVLTGWCVVRRRLV
jgi:hypothetical protein